MNVTAYHDGAGALQFTPNVINVPSISSTVSVTMVADATEGWSITGVASRPEVTWTNNTATLGVEEWTILLTANPTSQGGTSTLRISVGVRDER